MSNNASLLELLFSLVRAGRRLSSGGANNLNVTAGWALLLILTCACSSYADPIALTVGRTVNNGNFIITLVAADGSERTVSVTDILAGTSANNKALLIKNNTEAFTNDWKATIKDGATLIFEHKENDKFVPIKAIRNPTDGTGETDTYATLVGGRFDFGLATATAAGVDGSGMPSLVTVSTLLGSAIVPINQGDTAQFIIDSLIRDLRADGVNISPTSLTSFRITDLSSGAFISFQSTDISLPIQNAGAEELPEPATLLLLCTGLAGVAIKTRKRLKSGKNGQVSG